VDFLRDGAPVAAIVDYPMVMVLRLSFAAKTVSKFIAYAEADPGKIRFASFGTGGYRCHAPAPHPCSIRGIVDSGNREMGQCDPDKHQASAIARTLEAFDHLVGECERVGRNSESQSLSGSEVYNELELGRCTTGRSAGFSPLRMRPV
jgi:Tripartite tricarboxylate transporter family receptor